MLLIFIYICYLFSICSANYLENKEPTISYHDIHTGGAIPTNHIYPYVGFGCTETYKDNLYAITSTFYSRYWIRQSDSYKCTKVHKKVEVMKYNTLTNNYTNSILTTNTGDYIVSCGIDKVSNILYYISANYFNCPSSYNLDSSITRINLNTFTFIDNTLLKNIPNIPDFYPHTSSFWDFRYLHSPSTSINLHGNSLWLAFGGSYTGIWRLNITSTPIKLIDSYQKTYYENYPVEEGMPSNEYLMTVRFQQISKSFFLNNSLYFVDDTGYRDATLLQIDTLPFLNDINLTLNENNTKIIKLDGINYISDIEVDTYRNKIYIVTGLLNSEMYQFDFTFKKITLTKECNVDFLKFPTEWGVNTNLVLDKYTGFLYAFFSIRNKFVKINTRDLSFDDTSPLQFGEYINQSYIDYYTKQTKYNYYFRTYYNMNVTSLINDKGKMYVFPNSNYNYKKFAVIDLYGCSTGLGIFNNTCQICEPGKYNNEIGSLCKDCNPGYASNILESKNCIKCASGKYTTGTHTINCIDCSPGQFTELTGSSNCTNCGAGKYSIVSSSKNKDDCLDCQKGEISSKGSTSCHFCPIGKWAENRISCIGCSKGKYSSQLGLISDNECLLCPIGKFGSDSSLDNEILCNICPSGKIGIIDGASSNISCISCEVGKYKKSLTECDICPNGWISNTLKTDCINCPTGKWALNKKYCIDCPKGTYSFTTGLISSDECIQCQKGKYQPLLSQITESSCITCDSGSIGRVTAATNNDSCISCQAGKFKKSLVLCEVCPVGWISNNLKTDCINCPTGKWALNKKSCVDCPKGTYSFTTGLISSNDCIQCQKGKYQPLLSQITESSCITCDSGSIGLVTAAINNESCISCEAGKFKKSLVLCEVCPVGWISNIKSDFCIICPVGKISDTYGLECKDCTPGKYNDLVGISEKNSNCKLCTSGKYSSELGNTNLLLCKDCISGKYSSQKGLTDSQLCTSCPEGKYNTLTGQKSINSCQSCNAGKWNNLRGSNSSSSCIFCNAGYYSDIIGATSIVDCKPCPAGTYNDNSGVSTVNNCKNCATGTFSTESSTFCKLCQPGQFSSIMGAISCNSCQEGKFTSSEGSFICTDCPSNSEQNFHKTGCICSTSSYNTNTNNSALPSCTICSDEFICDKGTDIKTLDLKPHIWRPNKNSIVTYKCKNIFACKGGLINITSDELCQPGHKGPICDVCDKGYSKDDGVCLKCPENQTRTIGLTIFIPLVCIILIIFLIKTANPSENKKEEVNGLVKIFMNYAQVFSLASSFQINWPTLVRYLFERAKEFSSPRISFYSSDCAIGWSYYDKLIVYLSLPLFYMLMVTIIIAFMSLCYCNNKKKKLKTFSSQIEIDNYKASKPNCIEFFRAWEKTAVVVGTFLSWPTIVEKTLEVMNCEKVGNTYYLVKDFSVVCYDNKHNNFLIVSYIAIVIYGFGIPAFGFYLLYKYRYRLYDMQNRYDGSTPLSFLFLGYREKRWYYEFIIMSKKAGLILLSVFLRNYPRYQIIGASLLVQISFFLHVFLRPYDTITSYGMICNKLESISLLSLVMTLSTGLFFGTPDSGYELGLFEDVLIVLLILSNGGIVLYFFIYFLVLGKKTFITHLRDKGRQQFDKDKEPWFIRCCKQENKDKFKIWVYKEQANNYGIHLKNDLEKQIFSNYFKEKKSKLEILNKKIDNFSKRRVSVKLDKIRSEIQVMEKQRCWQTIQNNRLYAKLKNIAMVNKLGLKDNEIKELNDVFKLYIKHGVKYNDKMNDLYMGELKDMVPESPADSPNYTPTISETDSLDAIEMVNMVNKIIVSNQELSKSYESSSDDESVINIVI